MKNDSIFIEMLEMAVPMWQLRFAKYSADTLVAMARECANITMLADSICGNRPGEKNGKCANEFNAVARAIAILSLLPGGVRCFGFHWQYGGPSALNTTQPELLPDGLEILLNRPSAPK